MKKFLGYGILYLIGLIFIVGMFIGAPKSDNNTVISNYDNETSIAYNSK